MNVLEKILDEINDIEKEYVHRHNALYALAAAGMAIEISDIIRSHMNEAENGGWIPVSEYLPEVPEGTDDDDCPEFNVTIKGADKATTLKYSPDGTWFDESGEVYQVVAWQSLPEPYKPEEGINHDQRL